jgi:hypothetical protein
MFDEPIVTWGFTLGHGEQHDRIALGATRFWISAGLSVAQRKEALCVAARDELLVGWREARLG